jgi:hypothetical protein
MQILSIFTMHFICLADQRLLCFRRMLAGRLHFHPSQTAVTALPPQLALLTLVFCLRFYGESTTTTGSTTTGSTTASTWYLVLLVVLRTGTGLYKR